MSPRNHETTVSAFGNHANEPWENPFTQETSTAGFWDLYNQAQGAALVAIGNIDKPWFDAATAKRLTQGLDFSGKPTNALDAGKATASNPAKAKRTARTAKAGRDSQVHEGAKTGGDSPTHETAKVGGASPVHEGAKAGKGPQTHKRDR